MARGRGFLLSSFQQHGGARLKTPPVSPGTGHSTSRQRLSQEIGFEHDARGTRTGGGVVSVRVRG